METNTLNFYILICYKEFCNCYCGFKEGKWNEAKNTSHRTKITKLSAGAPSSVITVLLWLLLLLLLLLALLILMIRVELKIRILNIPSGLCQLLKISLIVTDDQNTKGNILNILSRISHRTKSMPLS